MMHHRAVSLAAFALLLLLPVCLAFPTASAAPRPEATGRRVKPSSTTAQKASPALQAARQKVAMLGDAYQLMVREIHDWYPNKTGQPVVAAVPIRQLQEIMTRKGWPASRFLGVTGPLMNPDHRPQDEFERKAVAAIRNGEDRYEEVANGGLRVATVVPLEGGCFICHWTDGKRSNRTAVSGNIPLGPPFSGK